MFEHHRFYYLLIIGMLLISVIACEVSFNESREEAQDTADDIDAQLTVQALQITQTAMAASPEEAQDAPEDDDSDSDLDVSADDDADDDETPCNSSKFVSETIGDGTTYEAGATFTKTWTLRNAGSCDWTTDYEFVFEEGDRMGGASTVEVPSVVNPGDKITFSVDLTAPTTSGDYTGIWRMKAADGEKMGKYWVKITVPGAAPAGGGSSAAFAVTSVSFPHIDDILCICPSTLGVQANITANGAGTVSYRWDDNKGGSGTGSVAFDAAGTKTVTYSMPLPSGGDGTYTASLYIDEPNHQDFGSISVNVDCN